MSDLLARPRELYSTCTLWTAGTGYGAHKLCNMDRSLKCLFYSFGINHDWSFDIAVSEEWQCKGFAFDPTVFHNFKLYEGSERVFFIPAAAAMLDGTEQFPLVTSVTGFHKWQKHKIIDVLKMDCEGCEYALASTILEENPLFFHSVKQFAIEVHVGNRWIKTRDHIKNLASLFLLLEEAGLKLQHATIVGCGPAADEEGCPPFLESLNYPCKQGQKCHNYLFARTNL